MGLLARLAGRDAVMILVGVANAGGNSRNDKRNHNYSRFRHGSGLD